VRIGILVAVLVPFELIMVITLVVAPGIAGDEWGWVWSTVLLTFPGTVIVVLFLRHGLAICAGACALLFVVGLWAGVGISRFAPPSVDRLAATLDAIDLPDDLHLESRGSSSGNCFDVCPSVSRTYRVEEGIASSLTDELVRAFEREGFDVGRQRVLEAGRVELVGDRGEFDVRVDLDDDRVFIEMKGRNG
jgi:hypothetical protein